MISNKKLLYYVPTYVSDMQNTFFYSEQSRENHDLIGLDS